MKGLSPPPFSNYLRVKSGIVDDDREREVEKEGEGVCLSNIRSNVVVLTRPGLTPSPRIERLRPEIVSNDTVCEWKLSWMMEFRVEFGVKRKGDGTALPRVWKFFLLIDPSLKIQVEI